MRTGAGTAAAGETKDFKPMPGSERTGEAQGSADREEAGRILGYAVEPYFEVQMRAR